MNPGIPQLEQASSAEPGRQLDRLERAVLLCIVLLLLLLPLALFSLKSWSSSYHVSYRVTGSASSAFISYRNARGGLQQREVQLPWQESFYAAWGTEVFLSLQTVRGGQASCEIRVDQARWRTGTRADGERRTVSCHGTLGRP